MTPGIKIIIWPIDEFCHHDATAGVREYWIVDPDKNRILIYNFESEDTGDYTFSDTVKAGIYEDLEIDFHTIEL